MKITTRHRRIAHAIWEAGGRLDEVALKEGLQAETLRRWLADPAFRALVAQDAAEPLLQATSAILRWAPAAVARLIQELDGDSAADARQAAREILRLALETQQQLVHPEPAAPGGPPTDALTRLADDPLARRVARLTDEQLEHILAILNADEDPTPNEKGDER